MIPKINFIWSFIYEQTIHNPTVKETFNYEEYNFFVKSFTKKVEKIWGKKEKDVLKYCEKITGLKWKKKNLSVYVIKRSSIMPISPSIPETPPKHLNTHMHLIFI